MATDQQALGLRKIVPIGDIADKTTVEYVASFLEATRPNPDSIVAIHGLDTASPRTWEFKKGGGGEVVNWLSHPDMLPKAVPEARIFTYNWDANCFGDAPVKTLLGHADTLLRLIAESRGSETRPIIFIASCFGGLILAEALTRAAEQGNPYGGIFHLTAGAIFLATPFRGSDAARLAQWAVVVGGIMGEQTSRQLVDDLDRRDKELRKLTQVFAEIARRKPVQLRIYCFYETKKTRILRRITSSGFFSAVFSSKTQMILVTEDSACLDTFERIPLDATHSHMNKFDSPENSNFTLVKHAIKTLATNASAVLDSPRTSSQEHADIPAHLSDTDHQCLQDLRVTDPSSDKARIEDTKGGLLRDSYRWILDNPEFCRWRRDSGRLLWIKGDPGKGKTMLLCGIIDELMKSSSAPLSFFFCQATDARINSGTAVLRGLLYLLVNKRPPLLSYVRERYDGAGKALFEDANAWFALCDIFHRILQDPAMENACFVIDALDECVAGLPQLLDFIARSASSRARWVISSRNRPDIEEVLDNATPKVRLSLELNEDSISTAVETYIRHKVDRLAEHKRYDDKRKNHVRQYLAHNANSTFLWVALVCEELAKARPWKDVGQMLAAFPPGLDTLYGRMMARICDEEDAELYRRILAIVSTVYRPITLDELPSLGDIPSDISTDHEALAEMIRYCGSFLTVRERTISFVHQSAKDFLLKDKGIFPSEMRGVHYSLFSRSLQVMSRILQYDVYGLGHPGFPTDNVRRPDPDPLATAAYSTVYWIDHLGDCSDTEKAKKDLDDNGEVHGFLRRKYLYWLEALSLLGNLSNGMLSMSKLEGIFQGKTSQLAELIRDERRFIQSYKAIVESNPLQVYASALIFSPSQSLTRTLFQSKEPKWIITKPIIENDWTACLQTFEGHSDWVNSVAWSPDGSQVASASSDQAAKVWDLATGQCTTLEGHSDSVSSVAWSPDGSQVASASRDRTVKVWDPVTGQCTTTLEGYSGSVHSVAWSPDGSRVATASEDRTVKVRDLATGQCTTLEGHSDWVKSVAWSPDSSQVASASRDGTVKIWDPATGQCTTLKGHSHLVKSVAWSPDGSRVASASYDETVKIWDPATGQCTTTLEGYSDWVESVAWSPDSSRVALASDDKTVKVWDLATGQCTTTLQGHSGPVNSVAWSADGSRVASASDDRTVKIWDLATGQYTTTLEAHSSPVNSVAWSPDGSQVASASRDRTVKVWDPVTGQCTTTLEGHSGPVNSVAWSPDGSRVATASIDKTVKVWDPATGQCTTTLEGHSDWVTSVVWSPDSSRVASASNDETVKVWDPATGQCTTLEGDSGPVILVAWSPDSSRVASASIDQTVKIWDLATGQYTTLEGHSHLVKSVAWTPDGSRVASASIDQTVKIWDPATGQCTTTLNVVYTDHLRFETSDSLSTTCGVFDLRSISIPINPVITGYDLENDAWVTYHGQNLLWLPPEYRPWASAVLGTSIVVGCGSGRVLFFKFVEDISFSS